MTLQEFASERLEQLRTRVEHEAGKTKDKPDEEAVHDLRVSIRRLMQAMRALQSMLPAKQRKRKRKRLRHWMDLAGEVRNRDIALGLVKEAGISAQTKLARQLAKERKHAAEQLSAALKEEAS